MKKDYQAQLEAFSVAETRAEAEAYLEKYWLASEEYDNQWAPRQEIIFRKDVGPLLSNPFNREYGVLPLLGGATFVGEKDLVALQEFASETMDKHFVVVQNPRVSVEFYEPNIGWRVPPILRFKFPMDISWIELMSGGYLSVELIQGATKDYFISGDSTQWGKYVGNSFVNSSVNPHVGTPLNILGFKQQHTVAHDVFRELLLSEEFSAWVPSNLR
jgi:hypothetical protein